MAKVLLEQASVRRSISLPADVTAKIDPITETRRVSANRAMADLFLDAIEAYEQRHKNFFELANRFQKSKDPAESKRLREELARMTFGS
jgi:hypothetical protein